MSASIPQRGPKPVPTLTAQAIAKAVSLVAVPDVKRGADILPYIEKAKIPTKDPKQNKVVMRECWVVKQADESKAVIPLKKRTSPVPILTSQVKNIDEFRSDRYCVHLGTGMVFLHDEIYDEEEVTESVQMAMRNMATSRPESRRDSSSSWITGHLISTYVTQTGGQQKKSPYWILRKKPGLREIALKWAGSGQPMDTSRFNSDMLKKCLVNIDTGDVKPKAT